MQEMAQTRITLRSMKARRISAYSLDESDEDTSMDEDPTASDKEFVNDGPLSSPSEEDFDINEGITLPDAPQ